MAELSWEPAWTKRNVQMTPYVEWWTVVEANTEANRLTYGKAQWDSAGPIDPFIFSKGRDSQYYFDALDAQSTPESGEYKYLEVKTKSAESAQKLADAGYSGGHVVPVPEIARNEDWATAEPTSTEWNTPENIIQQLTGADEDSKLPFVPMDGAIIGVIDTGIALGHRRFRHADGRTRVLASWQQTSQWKGQKYLPFGQELYQSDIDAMLTEFSVGGHLCEDAFNRHAHLVEPQFPRGHRDLDYMAAHGTHILDLAAGVEVNSPNFPPTAQDQALLDRTGIIAVNLPPQREHGTAGHFLQFYVAFAIERIVALADAIWHQHHSAASQRGFPVIINLSYGMQAGPRDGTMELSKLIRSVVRGSGVGGRSQVRVVMPAGNNNLSRGHAVLDLKANKPETVDWRILPSDQTSNFVEIWSSSPETINVTDFEIELVPPNQPAIAVSAPKDGHWIDLKGSGGQIARIYADKIVETDHLSIETTRVRFLLCVAPTFGFDPSIEVAPAGLWQISLSCKHDAQITLDVQSDQSTIVHSATGLQSYFEDADYETHLVTGELRDSFSYKSPPVQSLETGPSRVIRQGGVNALTGSNYVSAIAGFRESDGTPAVYSATARPRKSSGGGAKLMNDVQCAFPTDDGYAHYGVLGAGAKGSSTARFRGTSMATAMATRQIALEMLEWGAKDEHDSAEIAPGLPSRVREFAERMESCRPSNYKDASLQKIGAGRCPRYLTGRVPRRG